MRAHILTLLFLLTVAPTWATGTKVALESRADGTRLQVNGEDFIVRGMNWDYFPIGTNYTYSLWNQPDDYIISVLQTEMALLKQMGVNTLRIYTGIPKKWIRYIYEQFQIYTILNHPFGRYGLTVEGDWMANTRYDDPRVRDLLLKEVRRLTQDYMDTPGLLLFLLGNENNYGLFWEDTGPKGPTSSQREEEADLPTRALYKLFLLSNGEKKEEQTLPMDQLAENRAVAMYRLMNEAVKAMKTIDGNHPIAIGNGDLMFLELINEHSPDVDIFCTNMYRGASFGDTFQRVNETLNKPILFTEYGADAYHAIKQQEDQQSQAFYLLGNVKEIMGNAAGMGGYGNAIGGCTFQFSDGWWKVGQTTNLSIHDTNATWNSGGYYLDDDQGKSNMNEEWFGLCAKERTNALGEYRLLPRAAYFALKAAYAFEVYEPHSDANSLKQHFREIDLRTAVKEAEAYAQAVANQ